MQAKAKIADSIVDLIGRTPMVRLGVLAKEANVVADVVLKLESMEPCSSVKDRLGKALIEGAEARGEIEAGVTTLVEPTSGNTGIGMAMVAAAKGYKMILVMPSTMSTERRVMLKALGAELVLTPGVNGMKGSIAKANDIVRKITEEGGKARVLQQFNNPDNPKAHRETTGPEIWYQCDQKVDILIGGVGTGGTITGCAQYLKEVNPAIKVIGVEPSESAVLSGNPSGPHKIQGIGAGFIPENCHTALLDEIVQISSDLAIATARSIAVKEGVFIGISSGAAVAAAIQVGARPENAGKRIAVIIPSFGERYLSTALFSDISAEAAAQQPESVDHLLSPPPPV